MIFLIWIRYFAELCLYFGVALLFPKSLPTDLNTVMPALVLSLGIVLASLLSEKVNNGLRFIALVVPAVYLVFTGRTIANILILIPAVIYTVFVVAKDTWELEYYAYLSTYKVLTIGSIVLLTVMYLMEIAFLRTKDLAGTIDSAPLFWSVLIYAALGALLLKALRLGDELKKQSWLILLRELFVPVGLIVVFAIAFLGEKYIKEALLTGLQILFTPALLLVGLLSQQKAEVHNTNPMPTSASSGSSSSGAASMPVYPTAAPAERLEQATDNPWVMPIILIVLLTALMIALVFSVKKLRERSNRKDYVTERLDDEVTRKKRKTTRTNAEKIRGFYRAFLKKSVSRGVRITDNMTTGDISQQTASVTKDGAAEEELRRLYLSARYDDNANLSDEDVKQAGEVTKKIYG